MSAYIEAYSHLTAEGLWRYVENLSHISSSRGTAESAQAIDYHLRRLGELSDDEEHYTLSRLMHEYGLSRLYMATPAPVVGRSKQLLLIEANL